MVEATTTTTAGTNTNTTTQAGTQSNTSTQSTQSDWTSSLGDDLKGFAQNKGFKDPKDVVDAYRNFEKLMGAPKERLITLPESLEDKTAMDPIWQRLGAVKEAKEYGFEASKDFGDEKLTDRLKQVAHELKMPRAQAEGFVKALNEWQTGRLTETKAQVESKVTAEGETLKKDWGAAYDQNLNIANGVAQKFEMTKEQLMGLGASMGPAAAMKFLHKLGQGLGEAQFHQGSGAGGSGNINTPEAAKAEIKQLMGDADFYRRLNAGDTDASNRWSRLHKQASPGEFSV